MRLKMQAVPSIGFSQNYKPTALSIGLC